ncbi:Prenyltransferase/squalene oxidase [Lasiodiplodia theobromae]|uniref:Protein farnesyltransferase subunit beta n=1 Tax=Lasiodiplodia theobromae TaxID=45133 RepID=A0A5N5DNM1_9PEZI|nr:Protein farnesyltransferase subunit beta [Lasiodiplodia theobromae]KAF9635386.1 Prenyltransferase/squalene oxidase [Lasiodiplodia theobromae]
MSQSQQQSARQHAQAPDPTQPSPSDRLEELLSDSSSRLQEITDDDEFEDMEEDSPKGEVVPDLVDLSVEPKVPALYSALPPLVDGLKTKSSEDQRETVEKILPYHTGNPYSRKLNSHGIPHLLRQEHLDYAIDGLSDYPAPFVAMDASRPWIPYWSLFAIAILGGDTSEFREGAVQMYRPLQSATGGFGGGHGQSPHVIGSYASVLALVIVGGEEAYDLIDRKAMWHFLGRMKQNDGGFTVADGGEEDVRGAYCAMVIISLLKLPLDLPQDAPARAAGLTSFTDRLPEWISSCQTFEGGIGGAPTNEAHGAYAFCALACLCILGAPFDMLNRHLDLPALIHWLSSRQQAPEGGFAGRANKLVDGCYNHWVGGCWALVEAALQVPGTTDRSVTKGLWSREGMVRYILCACQGKNGGLRDKPGKPVDGYHSCYNLSGLSAGQYRYTYVPPETANASSSNGGSSFSPPLNAGFYWAAEDAPEDSDRVWDEEDRVGKINPVYVLPEGVAETARRYFEEKVGF